MWEGQGGFDFLGMHHRYMRMETQTGKWMYGFYQHPSKKAMNKMRERIRLEIGTRGVLARTANELVKRMNPILSGWRNYYGLKSARKWLNRLDGYILMRFTIWYNKKKQKPRHYSEMERVAKILQICKLRMLAA